MGVEDCATPQTELAPHATQPLTCEDASVVLGHLERLTLEPLGPEAREGVYRDVVRRFKAAPEGTRTWLADMERQQEAPIRTGWDGAEHYATRLHEARAGNDMLGGSDEPIGEVLQAEVVVWAQDDDEKLLLTERAIEGWIHYASLCREVQGGGVLRVSISDRVRLYRDLKLRFEFGSRQEKLALAALGPYWHQIEQRWQGAPYGEQQAWIASAPLPPPMVATSLGYGQQIIEGDVVAHFRSLNDHFGPLRVQMASGTNP
jgi:hypothetical protein